MAKLRLNDVNWSLPLQIRLKNKYQSVIDKMLIQKTILSQVRMVDKGKAKKGELDPPGHVYGIPSPILDQIQ
jgi:hypothetical protein